MLFPDTDSLTYEIKSKDVYEQFLRNKNLLYLGNYPIDSKFFDPINERVIGKMKDVSEGKINEKFVRLNSKTYSIKNIDGKESNTAKRVNIAIELMNSKTLYLVRHKVKRIQSKNHKIGTYEIKKIFLSYFDDKKFVLDNGIHALAYIYKDLNK